MKPILYRRSVFSRLALAVTSLSLCFHVAAQGTTPPFLGVDTNGNHISDVYEMLYPLTGDAHADDDNDGMSNENEAAAGTNPLSGADVLNFATVVNNGTTVSGSFPSVAGKVYQMQSQSTLGGTWVNEGNPIQGDGSVMNASAPSAGGRMFVRLAVSDQDSDDDGVNDWEELKVGTDRYMWDTDGDGTSDLSYVKNLVAASSNVNIYALNSFAIEGGSGTFRILRSGGFLPVTVPFIVSGTATQGTDYNLSAASVTLPAGVTSATVTVTALVDADTVPPEGPETIILTLQNGAGYTLGSASSATMTIVGQGITGEYYNFENGTYNFDPATGGNWDPAQLGMTRRDANIDFDWLGVAPAPLGNDDVWGARWQGFIFPKYSELYTVYAIADRGVKVYISPAPITNATGQLRLDLWTTTTPTTKYSANALTGSAPFVAGQAYYIRVDYRDSATNANNANIQIRWSSASQPEETIPSNRFTSENVAGAVPAITSPVFLTAISGAPFSYQITASGSPASFSASGLPGGLSVSPTGLITGTLSGSEGYHFATISVANNAGADAKNIVIYVATTGGGITRDQWDGLSGTGVLSVPVHTAPSSTSTIASLSTSENLGDGFGDRIRGYITAPATGLYTFFVTSDENAEVWISSNAEPANKLKRSFISYGSVSPGVWNAVSTQQSLPMMMKGGHSYFVEVIRRETAGADHLQVGWLKPGQTGTPEVIPGWALTPYTPPVAVNDGGYLYSAVLTPQTGASSLGNGTALLRVNADKTAADLTVTWGNLTGPVTNSHIHDSRSTPGPAGAIIFDVDEADPDRLLPGGDGLDPDEVYHWNIVATGNLTYEDVIAAIEGGTAYLNLHTAAYPNGEIKGFFQPVIGSQSFVPPADPPPAELTLPSDPTERKKEIVRFMQQATFGAAPDRDGATDALPVNAPFGGWQADSIEAVQQLGYAAWIDAQMAMDRGTDPEVLATTLAPPITVYQAAATGRRTPNVYASVGNGSGPLASYIRQYYERYPRSASEPNGAVQETSNELFRAWWKLSSTAPDQLRHRVAFALSQIMVVSEDGEFDERARWVGHYYDLLYYYGLDNFRTLMEKVTLNPTMGGYLDMLDNQKANPATGYIPNENYAREIMQLFTIGLRRLHPDGTLVLDSSGLPVPTYQQENVVGLAATLTGWRLAAGTGNWILPMTVTASRHDFTDKLLLNETYIPASSNQTTAQCDLELDQSHDMLFHHPNIAPFVCRELIQRMITANPSPGYVYRVARVFADNGSGVRGDMKAVIKALLLDPEARNAAPRTQVGYGHVKEPVVRGTQFIRAFRGYSLAESKPEWASANELGMAIFSPAVNVDLTQPLPQRTDRWPDSSGRTLSTALPATPATGSVTITLNSAPTLAVAVGDYLRIDNEDFVVTLLNSTTSFAADRAQQSSVAAAHAVGVTVNRLTPFNDNYIDEMIDPDGTGPLSLSQFSIVVQPGNLILLRRQTTGSSGSTSNLETISPENGLYIVSADSANSGRYKLTRAPNADTGAKVTKGYVMVSTCRREDGTLSANRIYYQERTISSLATDAEYWVNQSQTNTTKGPAVFSPATNINVTAAIASTTGTTRTATLTETIGGTNYNFTIQTNNILLLRRQTSNAGYINGDGNTSSPENGLYTVTNDSTNSARVVLVRNSGMNTADEFVNASAAVTQIRMDDGTLYPATAFTTAETPSRVFRQELTVTTVGTDPVRWSQQATGAGINMREAWGIGSTGSTIFNETPLKSPTVFNFYEPNYVFLGNTGNNGLYGPEFQITSETSVVNTANWFVDLTRRNSTNTTTQASPFSYGQGFSYGDPFKKDVKLDLTAERTLAGDTSALLDYFGIMLMPNQMSPRLKTLIKGFLDTQTISTTDADKMNRIGEALYLISLSPEFATQQ